MSSRDDELERYRQRLNDILQRVRDRICDHYSYIVRRTDVFNISCDQYRKYRDPKWRWFLNHLKDPFIRNPDKEILVREAMRETPGATEGKIKTWYC